MVSMITGGRIKVSLADGSDYINSANSCVYANGEVKILKLNVNNTIIPNSYTKVAELPSGYKPLEDTALSIINASGHGGAIKLQTSGNVQIKNVSGATLDGTYLVPYI